MPHSRTESDTAALVRVLSIFAVPAMVIVVFLFLQLDATRTSQPEAPGEARNALARSLTTPPALTVSSALPAPQWIWTTDDASVDDTAFFRRGIDFGRTPSAVSLRFSADNHATVWVDGQEIARGDEWSEPVEVDLTPFVRGTSTTIEIHASNGGGPAGVIAVVAIETSDAAPRRIVTDASWSASATADFAHAAPAIELGALGVAPWGAVAGLIDEPLDRSLWTMPGFVTELVYTVPREQGSWVSLANHAAGRLIASDQGGGLYQITPAPVGRAIATTRVEPIDLDVGAAQGLLSLDGDLYCVVAGPQAEGEGLYRIRDTDGDDVYDDVRLLRRLGNGGEHGPHAVVAGPDGLLYIVAGNHTPLPDPEQSVVPRRWGEDHLLPRLWDARGHAVGIMAPGGWVCRTDRDGETWELFANGFRNVYDIAFNEDGELFGFDADMEWDMGTPWYRPTRINHVVSGGEYGWRSGSGKWPSAWPDSLPAVVDVGPGSPTGVAFGTSTHFSDRYRRALFAADWTFGTIYAVHLTPDGATYRGSFEPFVTGRPLPVADLVANPTDGALYFVVGGRGVPSALYRVRSDGSSPGRDEPGAEDDARVDRETRRGLEAWHGAAPSQAAVDAVWPYLGDADRSISYAARIALEHQPLATWLDRLRRERSPRIRLAALLVMTRVAEPALQPEIIERLSEFEWTALDRDQRIGWLRAWSLSFIRQGPPDAATARGVRELFEPCFPADDTVTDQMLSELLVYLGDPAVVGRTVALMERDDRSTPDVDETLLARNDSYGSAIVKMAAARPQTQALHYARVLSHARVGWTPALRDRYFRWFESARLTEGGLSFGGFLDKIRDDALAGVPEGERAAYADLRIIPAAADRPVAKGPGRAWTTGELNRLASTKLTGRDFANGARMYEAALCASCHRLAGRGPAGGPDLSALSTRFSVRDIIEAIVEPSRTVSDQYADTVFELDDGAFVQGRLVDRGATVVTIRPSLLAPEVTIEVATARIAREEIAVISPMMPGLINALNEDEVLDLLAYLLAEGDDRHGLFGE